MGFELFWSQLQELADKFGERIADRDAWREEFDAGKTPAEAFFGEFAEHRELDARGRGE